MNGCLGCFALLLVWFTVAMVATLAVTYWAPILGFTGAWLSWRYVRSWYAEVE